jgi:hypothetical protein
MPQEPKPRDNISIEDLEKLIQTSKRLIEADQPSWTLEANESNKKLLLFEMATASHALADGILTLARSNKSDAARIVLRSMLENYINAGYIVSTNTDNHLLRFVIDQERRQRDSVGYMIKYQKEHDYKSTAERLSVDNLKKRVAEIDATLDQAERDYPHLAESEGATSLLARACKIDQHQKRQGHPPNTPFEWYYYTVYDLFCQPTHLGSKGLDAFIDKTTWHLRLEGLTSDTDQAVFIAFTYHLGILNILTEEKYLPEDELNLFWDLLP